MVWSEPSILYVKSGLCFPYEYHFTFTIFEIHEPLYCSVSLSNTLWLVFTCLVVFNLGLGNVWIKNFQVLCVCIKVRGGSLDKKGVILFVAFQKKWLVVILDAKALGLSVFPLFQPFNEIDFTILIRRIFFFTNKSIRLWPCLPS